MKKLTLKIERKDAVSCDIALGYDIMDQVGLLLSKDYAKVRSFLVTDSQVAALYGDEISTRFQRMGLTISQIAVPAGEGSKNMDNALAVMKDMLKLGADRSSLMIALGGGVVGDLAGFVASVYMRGIPCIQIPTTLMAQVDSSIGGKTAVDMPEGKNLIGTFYQPQAIYIDLKFLETLPEKEIRNGLSEVIKAGIIEDINLFSLLEKEMDAIRARDRNVMAAIVEKACRVKKGIVELDEREKGLRRILNFGHTLGHALEAESEYRLSHGEAVAIGCLWAARFSARMGMCPAADAARIHAHLTAAGMMTKPPFAAAPADILSAMRGDKKAENGRITLVLLRGIGQACVTRDVDENDLLEFLKQEAG